MWLLLLNTSLLSLAAHICRIRLLCSTCQTFWSPLLYCHQKSWLLDGKTCMVSIDDKGVYWLCMFVLLIKNRCIHKLFEVIFLFTASVFLKLNFSSSFRGKLSSRCGQHVSLYFNVHRHSNTDKAVNWTNDMSVYTWNRKRLLIIGNTNTNYYNIMPQCVAIKEFG